MTLLALGAHPDDVEYGCGGLLAAHPDSFVYIASDGAMGADPEIRRKEAVDAAARLGVRLIFGDERDTLLDARRLIDVLGDLIKRLQPTRILVNAADDTHQDHRALAQAALAAARYVPDVLAYETPTSTRFAPTVFADIGATLGRKLAALETHRSQVSKTPAPGCSIMDLAIATARHRGAQARTEYAEGFMPVRLRL